MNKPDPIPARLTLNILLSFAQFEREVRRKDDATVYAGKVSPANFIFQCGRYVPTVCHEELLKPLRNPELNQRLPRHTEVPSLLV